MNRAFVYSLIAIVHFWVISQGQTPLIAQQAVPKAGPFEEKTLPVIRAPGVSRLPQDSSLPPEMLETVRFLTLQGLSIPSRSKYREVELTVGSVWSNQGISATTHPWVLPAHFDPDDQRYAIAWNGLVYPVNVKDTQVSLDSDIQAILSQDEKVRRRQQEQLAKRRKVDPTIPATFSIGRSKSLREQSGISHETLNPLKIVILAELGEAAHAEKLWSAWRQGTAFSEESQKSSASHSSLWLTVTGAWVWAHFDRAVCAHARGDHVIAKASARQAAATAAQVELIANARGLKRQTAFDGKPHLYLEFARDAGRLADDEWRRINSSLLARASSESEATVTDTKQRIAALIRKLEDVSQTQWGQPGGVDIYQSPIVQALVKEGQAAVEPLLECIETDFRLTRSVSFHRDFHQHRELISVDVAAYQALTKLLGARTFGPLTKHGYSGAHDSASRLLIAEELRNYANQYGAMSEADRWFLVLADEDGTQSQWLEAAKATTQRKVDRSRFTRSRIPSGIEPTGRKHWPFAGESLRTRTNPSVTDLLIARANDLSKKTANSTAHIHELKAACELTLMLAEWDHPSSAEPIVRRVDEYLEMLRHRFFRPYSKQLVGPVARLFVAAFRTPELSEETRERLIQNYGQWLREATPNDLLTFRQGEIFEPLWRFPDDDDFQKLATLTFQSSESSWLPLHEKLSNSMTGNGSGSIIESPLVGVPAFRSLLQDVLKDRSVTGNVKVDRKTMGLSLKVGRSGIRTQMRNANDPLAPETDSPIAIRACDLAAWQLSKIEATPLFELYWPILDRDAAIATFERFLDKWGDKYRDPGFEPTSRLGRPGVRFRLAKLDHPATTEDAEVGRAIFSLETRFPNHEIRLVDDFPLAKFAVWTTLKKFPVVRPSYDPETKTKSRSASYDQSGIVWQAEEVLIKGVWKRFYGFVGRNVIAEVPADKLQFSDEPWTLPGFH